jgi:hypothetical protein
MNMRSFSSPSVNLLYTTGGRVVLHETRLEAGPYINTPMASEALQLYPGLGHSTAKNTTLSGEIDKGTYLQDPDVIHKEEKKYFVQSAK